MKFPPINEQMDLISRNAESIIPEEELVAKLEKSAKTGTPLNVKLGCDPSRPDLHLGHAVVLRKLRNFQDLGHEAILVVGDFTGMIGDPSGRNKTRPALTLEETRINGESYREQAGKVLSADRLTISYNSEWLGKLDFAEVIKLASQITVARMLERDDFSKRYREEIPISLHELLYPIAQAYDSVHLKADVELGGTDQTFNLLLGRDLQRAAGQAPQAVVITTLIEGTDGVEKMSKSNDNTIGLLDTPEEMFGKVLSIPDNLIAPYFKLCTLLAQSELEEIKAQLADHSNNPRDLKRRLAREIIAVYHDESAGIEAEAAFDKIFINKEIPDDIPELKLTEETQLVKILAEAGLTQSNGEGRRLISQGAVKIDGHAADDINMTLKPGAEYTLKVGKRRFLRVV